MADPDLLTSVLTHGGAVAGGGGVAAWIVRALFSGIAQRLDKIEEGIEKLSGRQDKRHDDVIAMISEVKKIAEAAHNRLDIYVPKSRKRS